MEPGVTCLSESTLVGLLDRGLPGEQRAEIEAHLDACAICRRVVVDLTAAGKPDATPGGGAGPRLLVRRAGRLRRSNLIPPTAQPRFACQHRVALGWRLTCCRLLQPNHGGMPIPPIGGQGERRRPGARASGGGQGQGERRRPGRVAAARASGGGKDKKKSALVSDEPFPTKIALVGRGTDVPWPAGTSRIRPDIASVVGDATPENRCKAAIPKVGP